ncbi:hypothetical protein [Escherichia sp. MOD1-EC7003]|uniref:hypothetical protein n=1 Tax=Escherichia sp. MOD1-EC7003 TaxID=2093900 RepID=UPI001F053A5A|nr:hypothetical protein [Escherichia sp. MOD1-EC7003]
MATARINVFCTNEELSDWLATIASKYKLLSIWFTLQDEYSQQLYILTEKIPVLAHRIYLIPYDKFINKKVKFSSIDRHSGWIEIKTGNLVEYNGEKILQLTEINTTDSEDKSICLCKAINWLKRQIKANEFSGVTGKNIIHGGETIYPHIFYTHQAKSLFYDKVIWKQDILFNSVYEPFIP